MGALPRVPRCGVRAPRLARRPAADLVRPLALLERPVLEVSVEGVALHHQAPAQDRRRGPRRHLVPFPGRVVGLVQVDPRIVLAMPVSSSTMSASEPTASAPLRGYRPMIFAALVEIMSTKCAGE